MLRNGIMNSIINGISDYKELTSGKSDYVRPVKKETYKAYCNSQSCSPSYKEYKLGMPKVVPKSTTFCKECGSALFWASENYYKKYI